MVFLSTNERRNEKSFAGKILDNNVKICSRRRESSGPTPEDIRFREGEKVLHRLASKRKRKTFENYAGNNANVTREAAPISKGGKVVREGRFYGLLESNAAIFHRVFERLSIRYYFLPSREEMTTTLVP